MCTKFSGDSPVEYQEEEIWYSDDADEAGPAESVPAKPEPFDLAAVNGKLAALDLPAMLHGCQADRAWQDFGGSG